MTTRLLALDLDGTLLEAATGRPHERDARAVRAAIAAGVRVTLVTGRLYSGTRGTAEALGLRESWPAPTGVTSWRRAITRRWCTWA